MNNMYQSTGHPLHHQPLGQVHGVCDSEDNQFGLPLTGPVEDVVHDILLTRPQQIELNVETKRKFSVDGYWVCGWGAVFLLVTFFLSLSNKCYIKCFSQHGNSLSFIISRYFHHLVLGSPQQLFVYCGHLHHVPSITYQRGASITQQTTSCWLYSASNCITINKKYIQCIVKYLKIVHS